MGLSNHRHSPTAQRWTWTYSSSSSTKIWSAYQIVFERFERLHIRYVVLLSIFQNGGKEKRTEDSSATIKQSRIANGSYNLVRHLLCFPRWPCPLEACKQYIPLLSRWQPGSAIRKAYVVNGSSDARYPASHPLILVYEFGKSCSPSTVWRQTRDLKRCSLFKNTRWSKDQGEITVVEVE